MVCQCAQAGEKEESVAGEEEESVAGAGEDRCEGGAALARLLWEEGLGTAREGACRGMATAGLLAIVGPLAAAGLLEATGPVAAPAGVLAAGPRAMLASAGVLVAIVRRRNLSKDENGEAADRCMPQNLASVVDTR